jgi:ABC-type Na+ transport system ATPase subunit NatA
MVAMIEVHICQKSFARPVLHEITLQAINGAITDLPRHDSADKTTTLATAALPSLVGAFHVMEREDAVRVA